MLEGLELLFKASMKTPKDVSNFLFVCKKQGVTFRNKYILVLKIIIRKSKRLPRRVLTQATSPGPVFEDDEAFDEVPPKDRGGGISELSSSQRAILPSESLPEHQKILGQEGSEEKSLSPSLCSLIYPEVKAQGLQLFSFLRWKHCSYFLPYLCQLKRQHPLTG